MLKIYWYYGIKTVWLWPNQRYNSLFNAGCLLKAGEAEIEILYIGKEEFKEQGKPYIVSREGRFGRVRRGGTVRIGDSVEVKRNPSK